MNLPKNGLLQTIVLSPRRLRGQFDAFIARVTYEMFPISFAAIMFSSNIVKIKAPFYPMLCLWTLKAEFSEENLCLQKITCFRSHNGSADKYLIRFYFHILMPVVTVKIGSV